MDSLGKDEGTPEFRSPARQGRVAVQAAATKQVIEQITPDGETLTTAINKAFSDRPTLRWSTALHKIADQTGTDLIDAVQAVMGDET